jgi:hypothetical protein
MMWIKTRINEMAGISSKHNINLRYLQGRGQLGDNIKMYIMKPAPKRVLWIHVAQDRDL